MSCSLAHALDATQHTSSKALVVVSTRCGTTASALSGESSLSRCYGLGSHMEVELVPTLLMAARYRRRLAFSDGPWSSFYNCVT